MLATFFHISGFILISIKKRLGLYFGPFFTNSSGHPGSGFAYSEHFWRTHNSGQGISTIFFYIHISEHYIHYTYTYKRAAHFNELFLTYKRARHQSECHFFKAYKYLCSYLIMPVSSCSMKRIPTRLIVAKKRKIQKLFQRSIYIGIIKASTHFYAMLWYLRIGYENRQNIFTDKFRKTAFTYDINKIDTWKSSQGELLSLLVIDKLSKDLLSEPKVSNNG
jgi:hypothetical protein